MSKLEEAEARVTRIETALENIAADIVALKEFAATEKADLVGKIDAVTTAFADYRTAEDAEDVDQAAALKAVEDALAAARADAIDDAFGNRLETLATKAEALAGQN